MKCIKCGKDFEAERATKKFCSDNCRVTYSRTGLSVTKPVPLSVTENLIVTGSDLSVTEVTPDIERQLEEAYKAFEKKYAGRKRGPTGSLSIPDIKCVPKFLEGKRVLTEWEKAVLDGRMVFGDDEEIYIEELEEDHKPLKFTNEKLADRIAAYRKEYEGVTYIPNWILHGFNSKEEALKEAMKAVRKSVGDSNSGL